MIAVVKAVGSTTGFHRCGACSIRVVSRFPAWLPVRGALLVFGGYANFIETVDFCVTGEIEGKAHGSRDPLNQPVVFINLVEALPGPPTDPEALRAAWVRYCQATWGQEEMKDPARFAQVAEQIAQSLPTTERELFLIGCRVRPGGAELLRAALRQHPGARALDPRPHLSGLRCPVVLVHGRDDDVIPYTELARLREALPAGTPIETFLTGLYGHSGRARLVDLVSRVPALLRELRTMLRMLAALDRCGTTPA